jgi:GT2 family glycosyltransferase
VRVGVATIQRGRRRHLERQLAGLAAQTVPPVEHVVVSMDPTPPAQLPGARVVPLPVPDGRPLPLAAARNAGVAALGGVDLVVLLDVDCIPGPELVARYAAAGADHDALLAGPVGHLPEGRPAGTTLTGEDRGATVVRGGRPVPEPGVVLPEPRHELFWSLSFAVRPATHARIGGFDEGYTGYGGEDTDYAFRARRAGVGLAWVGGAWAYHQHHPVSSPPREHVADIVPNARRFREVWGRWPMEGWLRTFAAEGLVRWDPDGDALELRAGAGAGVAAGAGFCAAPELSCARVGAGWSAGAHSISAVANSFRLIFFIFLSA